MIAITAISSVATGEGKRLVVTYSEVNDQGEFVRQNMKKNYVATAAETLAAIETLEKDAMSHIGGQ
ncbi:hypothetical protein H6B15_12115 [Gemmiger formicilis]|uniref:hypothetical protein n=1 Tax=Gemmiger formicilis TaxID=745368 RepID=UPI001957A299|nr:hypothetical protein [Gemmiger formicilis]MBM6717399.1 hypothetical protein [Gemmiger formicilis]